MRNLFPFMMFDKGGLFDFPFYEGVHAESEFEKPCSKRFMYSCI